MKKLKFAGNFCYCKRNQSLKVMKHFGQSEQRFSFHFSKKYSKKHK